MADSAVAPLDAVGSDHRSSAAHLRSPWQPADAHAQQPDPGRGVDVEQQVLGSRGRCSAAIGRRRSGADRVIVVKSPKRTLRLTVRPRRSAAREPAPTASAMRTSSSRSARVDDRSRLNVSSWLTDFTPAWGYNRRSSRPLANS